MSPFVFISVLCLPKKKKSAPTKVKWIVPQFCLIKLAYYTKTQDEDNHDFPLMLVRDNWTAHAGATLTSSIRLAKKTHIHPIGTSLWFHLRIWENFSALVLFRFFEKDHPPRQMRTSHRSAALRKRTCKVFFPPNYPSIAFSHLHCIYFYSTFSWWLCHYERYFHINILYIYTYINKQNNPLIVHS